MDRSRLFKDWNETRIVHLGEKLGVGFGIPKVKKLAIVNDERGQNLDRGTCSEIVFRVGL